MAVSVFATVILLLAGVIAAAELVDAAVCNSISLNGKIVYSCLFLIILVIIVFFVIRIWKGV